MLNMERLFNNAYNKMYANGYTTLYLAIDLHGTMLKHSYDDRLIFESDAIRTLSKISNRSDVVLILFTSTAKDKTNRVVQELKEQFNIQIKYVNENPMSRNTVFGCYDMKFYFDILLDDRAGFEPSDWRDILKFYERKEL